MMPKASRRAHGEVGISRGDGPRDVLCSSSNRTNHDHIIGMHYEQTEANCSTRTGVIVHMLYIYHRTRPSTAENGK